MLLPVLIVLQACSALSQTVNLTIANGAIQGLIGTTVRKNVTYYQFRGIPYAEPPVGDLRFRNPVKKFPWNGTLNATADRSQCRQFDGLDILAAETYGQEDCLQLNVYTPNYNATDLPVLVWIHGGTFISGNSSYANFGPDLFLEQGLVFVSFNYRMGIFGFFSTEDEACPGNWGIKDQILALHWVQENIARFGGNPDNVTIYGESAGSVSVHLLMQTNLTTGLFSKAIMNSGTTLNLWALNTRAAETARLTATALGILTLNHTEMVEQLRQVDAERLQQVGWRTAWGLFLTNGLRGLPYAPTLEPDIEGAVYVNPSDTALRQGQFQKVPVLMGFNSNEASSAQDLPYLIRFFFLYYDVGVPLLSPYSMTSSPLRRFLAGIRVRLHYFHFLPSLGADLQRLTDFISADQFNRPIRRAATDMSNHTSVYFYQFGYEGEIAGAVRDLDGTGHAEDNQYLFRSYNNYTSQDIDVSEKLVLLWSNFAKYGNPTPSPDSRLDNVTWQPVNPLSPDFTYLSINETLEVSVNPKQEDWSFYTKLWERFGDDDDEITTY